MERNPDGARYRPGQAAGHYESYFLRANHPQRPLAFWIRYTLFSPADKPEQAIGELWAVVSERERGRVVAAKSELPISQCTFDESKLDVQVGEARLNASTLKGEASSGGHRVHWDLRYSGSEPPVLLLPEKLYQAALPKAKSLVSLPMARFDGTIEVDGERWPIDNWLGSRNHNWGSRHTDRYAYGQVCGFDNAPESFLEIATAKVRLGPLWTPAMTPLVLRHAGREYALNGVAQSLKARAGYEYFCWRFRSGNADVRIEGEILAAREDFVGLRYYNPPGGVKYCLNSKLAACRLALTDRRSGKTEDLHTEHRAAFEILTDDPHSHGVKIQA